MQEFFIGDGAQDAGEQGQDGGDGLLLIGAAGQGLLQRCHRGQGEEIAQDPDAFDLSV